MRLRWPLVAVVALLALPVGAQNLVVNSEFDLDPTIAGNGWASVGTGDLSHLTGAGDPAPPSARSYCTAGETLDLSQCVPVDGGVSYDFWARSFTNLSSGGSTHSVALHFFISDDCSTGFLAQYLTDQAAFPNWYLRWSYAVLAPTSSHSARIELATDGGAGAADIWWDNVTVRPAMPIFDDGFETGGTSAWDLVAP